MCSHVTLYLTASALIEFLHGGRVSNRTTSQPTVEYSTLYSC